MISRMQNKKEFGSLFKKFRLRAEFKTLSEFGDSLQELGFFQEDSTFSRWENGSRIPRNRDLLIGIIKLFVSRHGIRDIDEANRFLEVAGQGFLTKGEESAIWTNGLILKPFQAPRDIPHFTGRKGYLKQIKEMLRRGDVVLIYGLPGSGKTALTIKLAHLLKGDFSDGVLWFRLDTSSKLEILMSIAESFGEDISQIHNPYIAASLIRSLLAKKRVLIIYDNATTTKNLDLLIPNSRNAAVLVTCRFEDFKNNYITERIKLSCFNQEESLNLFKKILKNKYSSISQQSLIKISNMFNNLPLAINVVAHHLIDSQSTAKEIIEELEREKVELATYEYENKNLLTAVNFVFKKIDVDSQNFLLSLGVFKGKDFSIDALSFINNIDKKTTKERLRYLIEASLVEHSSNTRFRLHPVVKFFIQTQKIDSIYSQKAIEYYSLFLKNNKEKINYFSIVQPEIYNINGLLIEQLLVDKFSDRAIDLWTEASNFLWYKGYWGNYKKLNEKFYKYSLATKKLDIRLMACTNLGTVFYWLGEVTKARKLTEEAIRISKKLQNNEFLAVNQDRLGKICQLDGNFKKADQNLKLALNYFENKNELEKKGNVLRHIAEGYLYKEDFDKAKKYFKLALKQYFLIKDYSINHMYQSLINSHLATTYYMLRDYEKAEKLFIESLRHEKRAGGRAGTKIGSMLGLALIYKSKNLLKYEWYLRKTKKEIEILGIKANIAKLVVSYYVLRKELAKNKITVI